MIHRLLSAQSSGSDDASDGGPLDDGVVFGRVFLASLARAYAAEVMRTSKARSRRDHLQNAAAALLDIWSEVAWRSDPFSRFFFAKGEHVRSELRFAADELRRAARPEPKRHRHRLILVAVPTAVALAVAAHARTGSDT